MVHFQAGMKLLKAIRTLNSATFGNFFAIQDQLSCIGIILAKNRLEIGNVFLFCQINEQIL